MRQRLVRALAEVPGARGAVQRVRQVGTRALAPAERRRARRLATQVASLRGREDAVIAVLGPAAPGLVEAVRAASPSARVHEIRESGGERHVTMTALGPFDVIVDRDLARGRRRRFEDTFFHLRPGGAYLVPGGAEELARPHGRLGDLLDGPEEEPAGGRPWTARERDLRVVVRNHVSHRALGRDLVVSHEVSGVLAKMREPEYNDYLARFETPHRLLSTITAEPPPPQPAGTEGPVPRKHPMHRPMTRATISLRDYRDVVVAPRQLIIDDRVLLPETFRHHQWSTLLHTQVVDHTARFGRLRAALPAELPRLEGTYLHLDNEFRGHFGHLLTESLSRVWSWPEALRLDPDAKVLVGTTTKRPEPMPYELELYEACGIPRDRVEVLYGPARVERLISGTPMFSHPHYAHPRIAQTWREVGDRLAAQAEDRDWPRRFFVGRRSDKRACYNGEEVEAIFAEYGFEVVYPEDYTLGEQVRLFRAAEVIGGYAGSGLFQIAFVPEPTHVVMVGAASYTPRNEYLMAAVHGHRIDAVICHTGGRGVQTSYSFDLHQEGPFLRGILDELP